MTAVSFSVGEAVTFMRPLALFVLCITIYAVFIFKFYRFLASRDIFGLNLQQYSETFIGFLERVFNVIFYIIEYLLVFPLFSFFWFIVLTLILAMLSRSEVQGILLVSMALVAAIRITAYYTEDLSRDLAKMLPFVLLGIFLVDISFFSLETSIAKVKMLSLMWKEMIYYLIFVILLEFALRLLYMIIHPVMEEKVKIKK